MEVKQYFQSIIITSSSSIYSNPGSQLPQQQEQGATTQTKSCTYESAMALLIQTLQPCFVVVVVDATTNERDALKNSPSTTTNHNIYFALSCIVGALQAWSGIENKIDDVSHTTTTTTTFASPTVAVSISLSISFVRLLSTFLYTYIGPILLPHDAEPDLHHRSGDHFYYDVEQIRDIAMEGLIALTQQCCRCNSRDQPVDEWIQLLCSMAMQGVEHRCAIVDENNNNATNTNDMNDDENDIYGFQTHSSNKTRTMEQGMALLPRSRRTLCFTLLQETVYSIVRSIECDQSPKNDTTNHPDASTGSFAFTTTCVTTTHITKSKILQLIQFTTTCLHGESDPRCLMQLLQLFATILFQFFPLFVRNDDHHKQNDDSYDYTTQMIHYFFDAVVPYYPIQFQPPPNNNIYGITRSSLRQAIMRIVSCTIYDTHQESDSHIGMKTIVDSVYRYGRSDDDDTDTSMSQLTCQLLLDCLLPSPNDEEPLTYMEQVEILEDLEQFLFTAHSRKARNGNDVSLSNLEMLQVTHQKEVAEALMIVHEKSSLAVSRNSNSSNNNKADTNDAKRLTDLCRSMITKIAVATERVPFHKHIDRHPWCTMVEEPVRKLSQHLYDQADTRIAIAYMACVTASGGYKTLNLCLECGLTKLLNYSGKTTSMTYNSKETLVTTIYGIGAFFASCRAALNIALRDGIHWYPHPLLPYCNEALQLILKYVSNDDEADDHDSKQLVPVAAIRALESILMVTPTSSLAPEQIEELVTRLSTLSTNICMKTEPDSIQSAYSETFGTLLGQVLDDNTAMSDVDVGTNQLLIHSEFLRQYFISTLLPALLASVQGTSTSQHDRRLLAKAAAYSFPAASYIIQHLTKALYDAIVVESDFAKAKDISVSMAFLFEQENQFAAQAYQDLSSPDITSFDILSALIPTTSEPSGNLEASLGMSKLQLPTSLEDRHKKSVVLENAYSIILPIQKGYEHKIPGSQLLKTVNWVGKVLPPLSDMDILKLSVMLPLLSVSLENAGLPTDDTYNGSQIKELEELIYCMIGDFADFTIGPEHDTSARVYAARCLHASIVRFTPHDTLECPVHNLMKHKLLPAFRQGTSSLKEKPIQPRQRETATSICIDAINVIAMLCSAAAIRGGKSSTSSDRIIIFLTDLACKKKSAGAFTDLGFEMVDLSIFDTSPDRNESSRLAILVATLIGSILTTEYHGNRLWRQRLVHIVTKRILEPDGSEVDIHNSVGTVTALCHVLCVSNITSVLSTTYQVTAGAIICKSLASSEMQVEGPSTIKLVLATILKMISTAPSCFRSVYPLVTGTLRAYAMVDESQDGIICKILALQVLSAVAQMSEGDFLAMETVKAIRPAVLSLLGIATDHPLLALRSAAVEVRNHWHVVS